MISYFSLWIYNQKWDNFTALPPTELGLFERLGPAMGLFYDEEGILKIMVAGGEYFKSSEIFDFEKKAWVQGSGISTTMGIKFTFGHKNTVLQTFLIQEAFYSQGQCSIRIHFLS